MATVQPKLTKAQMFEAIMNNYALTKEEHEFIAHEIELLKKKNASRKVSKKQEKNAILGEKILEYLQTTGASLQIKRILKEVPEIAALDTATPQYAVALLKPFLENGTIVRTVEKGKAYFSAA